MQFAGREPIDHLGKLAAVQPRRMDRELLAGDLLLDDGRGKAREAHNADARRRRGDLDGFAGDARMAGRVDQQRGLRTARGEFRGQGGASGADRFDERGVKTGPWSSQ
jgi:hypothetical protein